MARKNISSESNLVDDTVSALLESFPDAACLMDQKGVIINTNTLFALHFGKQPQECIGTNVYDMLVNVVQMPELAAFLKEKSEVVLSSGKRIVFADERDVRKVTISPLLFPEGEITRLLITVQNITEQKRIDRELHKERALKTALLDTIPCSAVILDSDLQMVISNQYARDMLFGNNENSEQQVGPVRFFCPDDMVLLRKKFQNTLNTGIDDYSEIRVQPHGSTQPIWMMTHTRRVEIDGKPCAVSIGIDITERKLNEIELNESKIRYGYAMDAAQSGIWEWNVKTDELSWSEQLWALYGLKVNSIPWNNQLCIDTVHPDDREMASWIIRNAVSAEISASLEYRVIHPDGSIHWLTSRGMPLRDNDGQVTRYIGTIIDITERKQIETELIESRNRLNQALEAASAGVWEWDLKTNENTWSDEIWKLFGLEKTDKKTTFDLWINTIHPDDRESAISNVTGAAKTGAELNVEYRVCHPDGATHWLMSRGKPMLNSKGKPVRYIGTIIDITGRKQIEQELTENKKRFDFALEATNTGVWEWNVNADKVTWSKNVWKLYGLEQNSLPPTHKLCESNIHPDDRDLIFEEVMAAASKEIEINIEYRVCHRNGSTHWLFCRGLPSYQADGRLQCYIGTVTDITSRKELLDNLYAAKLRLTQALNAARAGVWEWNLKTNENIWSDETWQLYGLPQADRKPSFDLWTSTIHPDDREMAIQVVSTAANNETDLNIEYRVTYYNGAYRWLMSRGKPLYDKHGQIDRYIGTIIDITERKEIEEKLRKSRERLDFVLDNSHIGVWDLNLQDGTTEHSFEHAHIFGYETIPPVWSLDKFFDHVIPADRPGIQAIIRNSIEKKGNYSFECRIHCANNELRWIWVAGAFKAGKNGTSDHVLGIVQDISGRKKSEQLIIEGKSQLDAALASMSDAVVISDVEGNFIEFNDAFVTFHKFKNRAECLKTLSDYPAILDLFMVDGEPLPLEQWAVPRALRGEEANNVEYGQRRKDTGETWVGNYNFSPIRDKESRIIGSVVTMRDITERKKAETEIRESEVKFRNIFDYSPIAIGIGDISAGMLHDVNKAWLELFGFSREEVIGHNLRDIGLFAQIEDHEKIITELKEHRKIVNSPFHLKKKSGETTTILFSSEFIMLHEKPALLVMMTDITLQEMQQLSIERLEKAVADRTQQLYQEVKRLNSFLNMISHEYRTPLAIIRGNLDLIELKNKHSNSVHTVEMNKIRRAIKRLVEVMEESIHESRVFESRTEFSLKPFRIVPVIASQVESLRALWPERTILYSESLEESEIFGDHSQLKLAIFNLLDNARKYSPSDSPIEIECRPEGDEAFISIRNQCNPISQEEAKLFFEKYQRGSNSMNTGGAGLGLWLVRNIINQHNGKVFLKGIASGVEATVRLPLILHAG
jgi:PAS domain S-box-containing protein